MHQNDVFKKNRVCNNDIFETAKQLISLNAVKVPYAFTQFLVHEREFNLDFPSQGIIWKLLKESINKISIKCQYEMEMHKER